MSFRPFFRFLDTVGDGSGTKNAVGDYSSVVTDFKLTNPASSNGVIEVHRLVMQIEDATAATGEKYGGGTALTNGIELFLLDASGNTVIDITDGLPIKNNGDWARYCYDLTIDSFPGTNDFVQVRWTFAKSGVPLVLKPGWSLAARLNDSMTFLVDHTFMVQGINK